MTTFGLFFAFALVVLGTAVSIDPGFRAWLATPRRLKLSWSKPMTLFVGEPAKIAVTAVNAAGVTVPLKAIPVVTCTDASVSVSMSADGLTATVVASQAGAFEFDGTSPEPTGTVTGSTTGTFEADSVPAKLVLTFV